MVESCEDKQINHVGYIGGKQIKRLHTPPPHPQLTVSIIIPEPVPLFITFPACCVSIETYEAIAHINVCISICTCAYDTKRGFSVVVIV